jgi:PilZ domain
VSAQRDTLPGPEDLPDINDLVTVDVGVHAGLPSRVEDRDVRDGVPVVSVALPRSPGGEDLTLGELGVAGRRVVLRWAVHRGQARVAAAVLGTRSIPVPVWDLRPAERVRVDQRRRYARARTQAPVSLAPVEEPGGAVSGQLVDLSEGGARRRLPRGTAPAPGDHVLLRMALDDELLVAVARVLRASPGGGAEQVTLELVDPLPSARRIRRYVLSAQARTRAASR